MRNSIFLISLLFFLAPVFADEEGKRGFVMDVAVSGFFSPEIKSAKVTSVEALSNAEKAGIKVGDELVTVFECKIPGCPAKKAKKMISKKTGETVQLSFRRSDKSVYSVELVLE